MWFFRKVVSGTFEVAFALPGGELIQPFPIYFDLATAQEKVHYLNGGSTTAVGELGKAVREVANVIEGV